MITFKIFSNTTHGEYEASYLQIHEGILHLYDSDEKLKFLIKDWIEVEVFRENE